MSSAKVEAWVWSQNSRRRHSLDFAGHSECSDGHLAICPCLRVELGCCELSFLEEVRIPSMIARSHNLVVISRCEVVSKALLCAESIVEQGWSPSVLPYRRGRPSRVMLWSSV